MGYNNNHAGMHMMRYGKYINYDNLDYYDKIVQEEHLERKRVEEKTKNKGNSELNSKSEKANKREKRKKKFNNKEEVIYPPRKYGTETIIEDDYFLVSKTINKNIMLYALKNRKDAYQILVETEDLLKKDKRTNAKLTWGNPWSWMPILNKSLIFLSIVAKKLECTIAELVTDDKEYRKNIVYKLLDAIRDDEWEDGEIDENGNATIEICNFDYKYNLTNKKLTIEDLILKDSMNLTLEKEIDEDNEINYSLSYGSLAVRITTAYDFAMKGEYLLEEEEGKLQETIDRLIRNHPEWKNKA